MTDLGHRLVRTGDATALRRGFALFHEALAHDYGDAAADRAAIAGALAAVARQRMDDGHFPTAIALLEEASVHDDDPTVRRLLAVALQRVARHDDAAAVLRGLDR